MVLKAWKGKYPKIFFSLSFLQTSRYCKYSKYTFPSNVSLLPPFLDCYSSILLLRAAINCQIIIIIIFMLIISCIEASYWRYNELDNNKKGRSFEVDHKCLLFKLTKIWSDWIYFWYLPTKLRHHGFVWWWIVSWSFARLLLTYLVIMKT